MTKHALIPALLFLALAAQAHSADPPQPWLDSLDNAYFAAQPHQQNILIFTAGEDSPAVRKQLNVFAPPNAPVVLRQIILVRLDPPTAEKSLGITTAPSLRLLSANGQILASSDPILNPTDLSTWIAQAITQSPTTTDPLKNLDNPDPTLRQSALRQLSTTPRSAPAVVKLLTSDSLQQRTAVFQLLQQWNAPLDGIDPWQPATLTPQRLRTLQTWAAHFKSSPTTAPTLSINDELNQLLSADNEFQARAIRERIITLGPAALPPVIDRLHTNLTDTARRRLLTLRYRLVATDSLAQRWPGGFDQLSSPDAITRRSAVAELAKIANAKDVRLFRELFTDDDPFLREQSLRLLRSVGGPETGTVLISLLADPEPNVRAAVLKTLADSPDPALSNDLVAYIHREQDPDLLVHAIHVLQVTQSPASFSCLIELLTAKQWRVRGEAAEAMLTALSNGVSDQQRQAGIAALIKTLDDEDGYVVSRAAFTLIKIDLSGSAAALMTAAKKRPELAGDVLRAVSQDSSAGESVAGQILEMAASPQIPIRTAALNALANLAPQTIGPPIIAGLRDPDPTIRQTGVAAVHTVLTHLLPNSSVSQWVHDFRAGQQRPGWLDQIEPDLETDLKNPPLQLDSAIALCALAKEKIALPILLTAAQNPANHSTVAQALPWLPSDKRIELFQALMQNPGGDLTTILEQLATAPDPSSAPPVWQLLTPPDAIDKLNPAQDTLRKLYLGDQYNNPSALPADQLSQLLTTLHEKVKTGSELQRTVALSILLIIAPEDAAKQSRPVYENHQNSEWSRLDALQILLTALPSAEADTTATAALADAPMRKVAIPFLTTGPSAISEIRGSFTLDDPNPETNLGGEPIPVTAPHGINLLLIRTVFTDAQNSHDDQLAIHAAYLMSLLGDHTQLPLVIQSARDHDWQDPWTRLAYRAIAQANDDTQEPLLEEIYRNFQDRHDPRMREFYWTIRTMSGPRLLQLRRTIRETYGMDSLR